MKQNGVESGKKEIIIPIRCYRSFIQQHSTDLYFLYSNDYFNRGAEGMAWFFAGEPNTFMLPSCYKMCLSQRYFKDGNFHLAKACIDEWFKKIPLDGTPIIPMPKMGMGCSRLKELAPKCYAYYRELIDSVAYSNIKYVYGTR